MQTDLISCPLLSGEKVEHFHCKLQPGTGNLGLRNIQTTSTSTVQAEEKLNIGAMIQNLFYEKL